MKGEHTTNGNQTARHRRQAVRVYRMHRDGMTVRAIASLLGKTEKQISALTAIGERFSESETGRESES